MTRKTTMLVVLDGWGASDDSWNNAVQLAQTPNFDRLWAECPHAHLRTSGRDVGLPAGQMGNSEVGHLNIGMGRVVMQDLPRIADALEDGSIKTSPALQAVIAGLRASGGTCHLLGLISTGGVHSHQSHAIALAGILTEAAIPVVVHGFTDGRDTPPLSAGGFFRDFEADLPPGAHIGTLCGRYYAMDRDNRWERVRKAYDLLVDAKGERFDSTAAAIAHFHALGTTDEFIEPCVIGGYAGMKDGDAVVCFNFRADRVRELLAALVLPDFDGFPRSPVIDFAASAGLTQYSAALEPFMGALLPPQKLVNSIGDVVAASGGRQLRMAESEKYPHVTYFLNGGDERVKAGEDRILVPSPKVATYDLQPEMSAPELTEKAVEAIQLGIYDLIVLNFANPDMVGHTGNLQAAIKAVEATDTGLGRIAQAIRTVGGALLVTADHGNCELMRDPITNEPHTAHTTNPVPVMVLGAEGRQIVDGRLADIAPTLLELIGLPQPVEMTGRSLLR